MNSYATSFRRTRRLRRVLTWVGLFAAGVALGFQSSATFNVHTNHDEALVTTSAIELADHTPREAGIDAIGTYTKPVVLLPSSTPRVNASSTPQSGLHRDDDDEDDIESGEVDGGKRTTLVAVVTPSYHREGLITQANFLLRVRNALCLSNTHSLWIIVQRAASHASNAYLRSESTTCPKVGIVHLVSKPKPAHIRTRHRAVEERNTALEFLHNAAVYRQTLKQFNFPSSVDDDDPVVYFADDDNEYAPRLFREVSKVKKIGMLPVGMPAFNPPVEVSVHRAIKQHSLRRESW